MYAIVKTGGKQYRVETGQRLLVELLSAEEGQTVILEPLLYRGDDEIIDGKDLANVKVEAKVLGHQRGPKLIILKFKPKRGYKRRTGHRQDLTRIEITNIKFSASKASAKEPVAAAATTTEQGASDGA